MNTSSPARQRGLFYAWNLGLPLLCAVLTFVVFDLTSLDRWFGDQLYQLGGQHFPLQSNGLFEHFTHNWTSIIPDTTSTLAIIGSLLSFVWPRFKADRHSKAIAFLERVKMVPVLQFITRHRRDFLFVVVAFAIDSGMTRFLKVHTNIYCPVQTLPYGGTQEMMHWFENFSLLHEPKGTGRCWPGGHAVTGFSIVALYFVALRQRWQHARKVLYVALAMGVVYGTIRVFQGIHFMSHTPWGMIMVWLCTLFTALAFYGRKRLQQPALKR
ncbi:MAG: phosphatase PAP2 family protein [Pseudomonas sp.]|nr:phosphatase PAP2 family protein [Pseudomonas sp.]